MSPKPSRPRFVAYYRVSTDKQGRSGLGIEAQRETVKRFGRESVRKYYENVYEPSSLIVTAAGNLTHERLVALVREHFESMPAGPAVGHTSTQRPHAEHRARISSTRAASPATKAASRSLTRVSPRRPAAA